MQAPQIAANPFHLIKVIRFELTTAKAWENGKVESLMLMKRAVVKEERRSNGHFIFYKLKRKLVFFKDLFCGPALRTIELYHIAMALFVLELINAVLIAV